MSRGECQGKDATAGRSTGCGSEIAVRFLAWQDLDAHTRVTIRPAIEHPTELGDGADRIPTGWERHGHDCLLFRECATFDPSQEVDQAVDKFRVDR